MEAAYITATIPLMKKPPKLAKLLVPLEDQAPRRVAQPWQQQMSTLRQIMEAKRK